MSVKHFESCPCFDLSEWEKAVAEYAAKWPNHCGYCGGRGAVWGYASIDGFGPGCYPDPCVCLEFGSACPRCGVDFSETEFDNFIADGSKCPHCEWHWGKSEGDFSPAMPECVCYYLVEKMDKFPEGVGHAI